MKSKKKTQAAIVSAVLAYIKSEEEVAVCLQGASAVDQVQAAKAAPGGMPNIWGLSGRQAQMQMRGLLQMKSFHGAKFK